jgi:hypothetical protein
VVVFDWFKRRRASSPPPEPMAWEVRVESGEVVAEDGRGAVRRASLAGVRAVRVVPLGGGDHHARAGGAWQVTLARPDGDVLLGTALPDWQSARELGRLVCERTRLPLDELTQRLFSRVGTYSRPQ